MLYDKHKQVQYIFVRSFVKFLFLYEINAANVSIT